AALIFEQLPRLYGESPGTEKARCRSGAVAGWPISTRRLRSAANVNEAAAVGTASKWSTVVWPRACARWQAHESQAHCTWHMAGAKLVPARRIGTANEATNPALPPIRSD